MTASPNIGVPAVQLYNMGLPVNKLAIVPYVSGVPVPIDLTLGDTFEVTVTDAAAITIDVPFRSDGGVIPLGHKIQITMRNTSGGALGALTFNSLGFRGNTSATPATGNSRTWFMYYSNQTSVGNRFIFTSGTPADTATG